MFITAVELDVEVMCCCCIILGMFGERMEEVLCRSVDSVQCRRQF